MLLTIHHPWPDPHPAAPEFAHPAIASDNSNKPLNGKRPPASAPTRRPKAVSIKAFSLSALRQAGFAGKFPRGLPKEGREKFSRVNPALCIGLILGFDFRF